MSRTRRVLRFTLAAMAGAAVGTLAGTLLIPDSAPETRPRSSRRIHGEIDRTER